MRNTYKTNRKKTRKNTPDTFEPNIRGTPHRFHKVMPMRFSLLVQIVRYPGRNWL